MKVRFKNQPHSGMNNPRKFLIIKDKKKQEFYKEMNRKFPENIIIYE